jgi:hypothetical protein
MTACGLRSRHLRSRESLLSPSSIFEVVVGGRLLIALQLADLSVATLRTIAARTSSPIHPITNPSPGLMIRVARTVTPITGQQEGRASNSRRETARSVRAMISNAPTAPIGIIANRDAASSANPTASTSRTEPKMIGASPVCAPKRY